MPVRGHRHREGESTIGVWDARCVRLIAIQAPASGCVCVGGRHEPRGGGRRTGVEVEISWHGAEGHCQPNLNTHTQHTEGAGHRLKWGEVG